jgi:bifunctional N-acetylglucosamine-1-phosphate-uridyltransferase/glucosamine-1-phosphate-acetyltransferase GlmU-like protein
MVDSIVIAAGGIGSRMSHSLNRHKSKALIEYNGKPLIHYLLSSAKEAGITNFFISVNEHNQSKIEAIADSLGIAYRTNLTGHNFAQVPALFKDELDYKFLVICGHDPVPKEHIQSLLDESKTHDAVTTAYDNLENITANKKRIRLHMVDGIQKFEMIDLNKDLVPENHVYVRNPYMINQDILQEVIGSHYEKTAGYFVYQLWKKGGQVTSIKATMPVEFDTDIEFERTRKYLDDRFGTVPS